MKVLQITNSLNIGGAEKLVSEMIPHFVDRGIPTDLLILKKSKTFLYERLNDKGVKVDFLSKGSVYNPLLIFKIIPYLKEYDLIHIHLFPTLYWVVIAKFISFSKTKLVYTEHSTSNKRRRKKIFRLLDSFIYFKLSSVACISDATKENLSRHLILKTIDIQVVLNGIDLDAIKKNLPAENKNEFFGKDDFVLIQVSSFREQKDQRTLVKSLLYLPSEVKLILVGEGYLKTSVEDLVRQLNLQDRVLFLGLRNDVPQLLYTADVCVLSSRYEGFGLAILEGMALAKPSIATDVEGIREIVDGHGLLFKKGNSKDLADKISSLYYDKSYYKKIALQCLHRSKQFDIKIMVDRYIGLYQKIS